MPRFDIGDVVKIQYGSIYPSYSDWVIRNVGNEDAVGFTAGDNPDRDSLPNLLFIIVACAPHEWGSTYLYYVKSFENGKCYIVDEDGIQKIERGESDAWD